MRKRIVFVIGPEASGTRLLTQVLSQHPKIAGSVNGGNHDDLLDGVWTEIRNNDIEEARRKLKRVIENNPTAKYILTRRSMPHGHVVGQPARYMGFPPLEIFAKICVEENLSLFFLVTVRSITANLTAWIKTRASVKGDIKAAFSQYEEAYKSLFDFFNKTDVRYFLMPFEAIMLDDNAYVKSIFKLLGLRELKASFKLDRGVNKKRYKHFLDQCDSPIEMP
ncbi:MAG: hypothetical protein ABH885_02540 [Candidatus Omnitrophota bacterium]